ncbi:MULTISPECIES: hypothetical protein [Enterobacteriaceae]|nr:MULTISPECIES: hypothetical protein [Enterobacteriaceae]ULJ58117.1 hypothetical protein HUZ74_17060 [Shigella flexneri]WII56791.1 hypothetical protein N5859_16970 [Escherichia coli]WMX77423.1 hypothetical protein QMY01_17040 [Escherichia coli]
MGEISVKTGNNARNGGKNSLNRLIRCVCGKKIGPDPRNFNQRVSLGRNDLLIRTFLRKKVDRYVFLKFVVYWSGMTLLSTLLIYMIEYFLLSTSSIKLMALTKVVVEIFLFFISFLIAKIWVYKK